MSRLARPVTSGVHARLPHVTALEIIHALQRRHSEVEGEWVTFREAWRIDFFALRCWTSGEGFSRVGYEIKCSRSDFLSEMRKPEKRAHAVELSHKFYFATPRGMVKPDEVPDDCGLVYVNDGHARVAKRAPVREPRALKMSEVIYLMRLPGYRSGTLELRRRLLLEQSWTAEYSKRLQRAQEDLGRAHERLLAYAGDLVQVGSMWRGRWQPRNWIDPVDSVDIYVEKIHGRLVAVRRVDNGEIDSFMAVERLLTDYRPLDSRDLRVLGAA